MRGKITFIGSGNLAFHLATTFDLAGYQIHQVIIYFYQSLIKKLRVPSSE